MLALQAPGWNRSAETLTDKSPTYAAKTTHPCQRTGNPQPQPYRFAGNQISFFTVRLSEEEC